MNSQSVSNGKMKASIAVKYGSPDVLRLREFEKPVPKDDEVLIKVMASVVTPSDCAIRKANPFATRFIAGLTKPKYIPGCELAGEVEAVGKAVTCSRPEIAYTGPPSLPSARMPSTNACPRWAPSRRFRPI